MPDGLAVCAGYMAARYHHGKMGETEPLISHRHQQPEKQTVKELERNDQRMVGQSTGQVMAYGRSEMSEV